MARFRGVMFKNRYRVGSNNGDLVIGERENGKQKGAFRIAF